MTASYDKLGLKFFYPQGWQITEDDVHSQPRSVSLQSPKGAEWNLLLYEGADAPVDLAVQVLESLKAEYQDVESNVWSERFDEVDATGYDMYFYYLDLLVHSRALGMRWGAQAALLVWQAEDREFDELEPVFRAMTLSFLNPQKYSPR